MLRQILPYVTDTGVTAFIWVTYDTSDAVDRVLDGGWTQDDIDNAYCVNTVPRSRLKPRKVYRNGQWNIVKDLATYTVKLDDVDTKKYCGECVSCAIGNL